MTQTFPSSLWTRVQTLFASLPATGEEPRPPTAASPAPGSDRHDREHERDDEFYRFWAMHGHW